MIAHIEMGHYQISREHDCKVSVAFNYHPEPKGLNWRTNLYYLETTDFGKSWQTVKGDPVELPLTTPKNKALIKDYESEGLNCYLKDIDFDEKGNPVITVISSKGYESGPENNPRNWEFFHFKSNKWENHVITTSDNNYDMGSLYPEGKGVWRVIGPTEPGPQRYNPGGEIASWVSTDDGNTWKMIRQLTRNSEQNHTYVRKPIDAQPDIFGIWADGHGRKPSESFLYFCTKEGAVFQLPRHGEESMMSPIIISADQ